MKKKYGNQKKKAISLLAVVAVCLAVGLFVFLNHMGKQEEAGVPVTEEITGNTEPEASEEIETEFVTVFSPIAGRCWGMRIVSSLSSGGMQLLSLQIIHSRATPTEASAAVSSTRCAKRAFFSKVPISMPNTAS